MSKYWTITPEWEGETCAILGGGPSTPDLAARVKGKCRAIAVNNAGIKFRADNRLNYPAIAPWADILYAADDMWWYHNAEATKEFRGRKVTIAPNHSGYQCCEPEAWVLRNASPGAWDDRPDFIVSGSNSGYQALQVAIKLGAKRVLLCGFEMHGKRKEHWFGGHAHRPGFESRYSLFMQAFIAGAPIFERLGIEVINCTSGSALECFPYLTPEEALDDGMQVLRTGEENLPRESAQGFGRLGSSAGESARRVEA